MNGALGAISDKFDKHAEEIGIKISLQMMQTALLDTSRILRKVCFCEDLGEYACEIFVNLLLTALMGNEPDEQNLQV